MAKKIRISRHGLTSCPVCSAHIRVEENLRETTCPFCGAELLGEGGGVLSSIRDAVSSGRSGLVAASLFGLTALAGCGDDEEPSNDATDVAGDTNDMMEDTAGDATDMSPDDAPDLEVQPLYGAPADLDMTEEDMEPDVKDADDVPPQPLYGIVPEDMG